MGWKLPAGLIGIFAGLTVIQHPIWSAVLAADYFGDHVWCKWDHPPQGCKIEYCSHA